MLFFLVHPSQAPNSKSGICLAIIHCFFFMSSLSTDQFPPPFISRNKLPRSIAQSVLPLCIICQNPSLDKISVFVVAMATIIIIKRGMLANLVKRPIKIKIPQRISIVPTKDPRSSGEGNHIFSNRPAPRIVGNKNF